MTCPEKNTVLCHPCESEFRITVESNGFHSHFWNKEFVCCCFFNWNLLRCRLLSSYTEWLLSWISTIYFEYGLHVQLVDRHCFLLGMGFTQIIQELPEANLYQLFTSPLPLSVWITHLRSQRDFFFSPRKPFFFCSLLFQGRGGNRAVSWPPIGSSSPLTLWYFRNVLLFSAQLQPARFQVETRQEGEWLSKREYT